MNFLRNSQRRKHSAEEVIHMGTKRISADKSALLQSTSGCSSLGHNLAAHNKRFPEAICH